VVVLGARGRVAVRVDPFVAVPALTPETNGSSAALASRSAAPGLGATGASAKPADAGARDPLANVRTTLARLLRTHQIDAAHYRRYSASLSAAQNAVKHLHGTRALELGAVIENLHDIAGTGALTASRVPALILTLDRNRQWWVNGPLLTDGQRVEFAGSELVWEYYRGQGIELQELANFAKANGLYTAGPSFYAQQRELLAELIPLAADRGGGLAWEYYFHFDGGAPPWTSAMSQATALEALSRAYQASGNRAYLILARRALPVFEVAPPVGVAVKTRLGRRYLLYSFAPGAAVINGFLQSVIGLGYYARVSGDQAAAQLFAAGDAEARAEVPRYDTGAWSLYQSGVEDPLSYHTVVTGFLQQLCATTRAPVYCVTAAHFVNYLSTPPALRLLTARLRAGRPGVVRFRLSKISRVGITLLYDGHTTFLTSAPFAYGVGQFRVPAPTRTGTYAIHLTAKDLAGNYTRIVGAIEVSR
ncbi:MAG: hypothetical protein JOY58_07755, partial [Solirubrobacterales bacterium]|nr:hypothetical protein [Solirubrobacterales bacterium]